MAWFKVDDTFYRHSKTGPLSFVAKGLWLHAGSWCADQLTDGFVPARMLRSWSAPEDAVAELVECGCWTKVDGGYQFHDWLDYQPSREKVLADRAAGTARKLASRSRLARDKTETSAVSRPSLAPVSPPPDPDPVPIKNSLTRARVREEQESDQSVGSDFMFNATGRHWMGYERSIALIGAKPEAERRKALETMQADPWVRVNLVHCNPDHVLKKWPVYSTGAGAPQLVAVQGVTSEQQEAKRRMEQIRSQARTLKAELARLGDDVDGQARRFTIEQELTQLETLYDRAKRNAG